MKMVNPATVMRAFQFAATIAAASTVVPDIDLVITDQSMPGMTGVQLAKAIKAENPAMPIIIATGYSELPEYINSDLPKLAKSVPSERPRGRNR